MHEPAGVTAYPSSPAVVGAAAWMQDEAPNVAGYFAKVGLTNAEISELLVYGDENQADAAATAENFLQDQGRRAGPAGFRPRWPTRSRPASADPQQSFRAIATAGFRPGRFSASDAEGVLGERFADPERPLVGLTKETILFPELIDTRPLRRAVDDGLNWVVRNWGGELRGRRLSAPDAAQGDRETC